MATTTLAVAGGRAALLGGLTPLLLLAGVLLLVLAAPQSKERIAELREQFQRLSGSLPGPVRSYLETDEVVEQDEPDLGWRTSDPAQFADFFSHLADDTPTGPAAGDDERPGTPRTH